MFVFRYYIYICKLLERQAILSITWDIAKPFKFVFFKNYFAFQFTKEKIFSCFFSLYLYLKIVSYLTLYCMNSFFVVFRDIAQDRLYSSTDS